MSAHLQIKELLVDSELDRMNIMICGMSEVRRLQTGAEYLKNYKLFWSGNENKRIHGVGILVHYSLVSKICSVQYLGPRIICMKLKIGSNQNTDSTKTYIR